jgi:hypothetical protein
MNPLWKGINTDISHLILSFEGSLKYRNGKWMNPLDLPKEIQEKISNCIKRKYNSIDIYREIVGWSVEIHTYKRLSLFIRKESDSDYIGDYRIINYKNSICHSGEMTFATMLIDDITTFNVIW